MTDPTPSRRDELIAAALADDLSPDERVELDALRAADPGIDAELAALAGVTGRLADLGAVDGWHEAEPDDALRRRIAAIGVPAAGPEEARLTTPHPVAPRGRVAPVRRRRALLAVLGAAACLAVGAGAGALIATPRDSHVEGPAGTLGAVEHVSFVGAPSGVEVDGDVVAHTWGTETVLTVEGLPSGDPFTVVVVGDDGREYASGTFLGSDVTIDCSLNAAVLREHVSAVEIRGADGSDIAVAEVPAVEA